MKYFVFNQENGFIGVAAIVDEAFDPYKMISPEGVYMTMEETNDLDNDFFNAMTLINGKIHINLKKAKNITLERVRREREGCLTSLDILYQRALESGKDLKEIEQEKQRLRDLPNEIEKMTTSSDLKKIVAKTELTFDKLKPLDYSTDEYIMNLQKENEQLRGTVNNLTNEMTNLMTKLKKKFII
jgi:hypothetical protein